MKSLRFFVLFLLLLLAGCGVISLGASNSPDWCPTPNQAKICPP